MSLKKLVGDNKERVGIEFIRRCLGNFRAQRITAAADWLDTGT